MAIRAFSKIRLFKTWQSWLLQPRAYLAYKAVHFSADSTTPTSSEDSIRQLKERSLVLKPFFQVAGLEDYAGRSSVRLTPTIMLYSGRDVDPQYLIKTAQYIHRELPVRIAHRIDDMRNLPFSVACCPAMLAVHDLYVRAFDKLRTFRNIETKDDDIAFCRLLRSLLHDHRNVVTYLAEGFDETSKYIKDKRIMAEFCDKMLTSRLGIRILAEHYISLHEDFPNHVGIINLKFSPKKLLDAKIHEATEICQFEYGVAPQVNIIGQSDIVFPYISQPIDYILYELLKNAFRATVETHLAGQTKGAPEKPVPPVVVTIVSNDVDFMIRISDLGGGIPHDIQTKVFEYLFTTGGRSIKNIRDTNYGLASLGAQSGAHAAGPVGGPMHGYGFGLPLSRAYAEYLGGSLTLETMKGLGTDVYLRLRHIDGRSESFRI